MKKFGLLAVVLVISMIFVACGSKNELPEHRTHSRKTTESVPETVPETEPPVEFPNDELAAQCLTEVINAPTVDFMRPWLTEDSVDLAADLLEAYKDRNVDVAVRYCDSCDGYDIYACDLTDKDTGEKQATMYCILQSSGDSYRLCINSEPQNSVFRHYTCATCNGGGTIITGSAGTCGQCGGTGMWYNSLAYYDSFMNMWMGQYQGCPGCGGSGSIGGTSTSLCPGCGGDGLTLN